jgi:putative two-component system hydrogenase maturation factor HypX/HoxX
MSRDIYGDRSGFAAARHAFVTKARATGTPPRLRFGAAEEAGCPVPTTWERNPNASPAVPMSA